MSDAATRQLRAGWLIGIGMGGFVDGIVLHQLLQWHNMLSGRLPPIDLVSAKVNMFWDGMFHAAVWIVTGCGIALLWRACANGRAVGSRRLFGAMLLGWAAFNVVEGAIDHHWLGLHHVREFVIYKAPWDWGFTIASVVLGAIGWWLARAPSSRGSRSAAD